MRLQKYYTLSEVPRHLRKSGARRPHSSRRSRHPSPTARTSAYLYGTGELARTSSPCRSTGSCGGRPRGPGLLAPTADNSDSDTSEDAEGSACTAIKALPSRRHLACTRSSATRRWHASSRCSTACSWSWLPCGRPHAPWAPRPRREQLPTAAAPIPADEADQPLRAAAAQQRSFAAVAGLKTGTWGHKARLDAWLHGGRMAGRCTARRSPCPCVRHGESPCPHVPIIVTHVPVLCTPALSLFSLLSLVVGALARPGRTRAAKACEGGQGGLDGQGARHARAAWAAKRPGHARATRAAWMARGPGRSRAAMALPTCLLYHCCCCPFPRASLRCYPTSLTACSLSSMTS